MFYIYAYGGTNGEAFKYWSLTAAINNDQSFCEGQPTTSKCLVFSVDSDEDVIEKVKIVCNLFLKVTQPELLEGTIDFALLQSTLGVPSTGIMQRSWSLRPLTKAFEEDTGLKVGL
ncbi:hypothetical protein THAOC_28016 [Thalassiosira oceanica]|uniref:Uncharacterized protein n=1 Tax=Thalassiosira oceanica TaxID=159749 RepID=K0S1H7_THAOC|nr:hypothetical protein THAOC_28016 [Thalassiosira oceanica]|eukprot:EJK52682.1 hypothetical protein THAOC_28016 [Thalassiosira oceanica]